MHTIFKTKRKGTNKSKVLFSCHPSDFDRYFSELTDEILSVQDCSIYYLEDQNYNPEDLEDYKVQLSQFNLFVFPITYKFLSEESRTKDINFKYAIENNYPVLPILVEPGLYDMFNKLNTIQVLDKTTNDPTQDPYKVKLEKYVKSVLLDDDTVERIKKAFDAYIFLSYRKKDRKYAQEIMSLIHKSDFMRDIAIWYDEFLTPGEDFNDEISENLLKSKLMALVVTPNINERYGEKGNYVIEEEYPHAVKENKHVLPIEAVKTNKEELKNNFKDIDDPIYKEEVDKLTAYFKQVFGKYNNPEKDNDPEHLFFIGLAYLNGIDTDRDPEKAIKILEESANMGLDLSIKKLVDIYSGGISTKLSYPKAIHWQKKLVDKYSDDFSNHTDVLNTFAYLLKCNGDYQKSLEINIYCYELRSKMYGEKSIQALESLNNIAANYLYLGDYKKSESYSEKCYELIKNEFGEFHVISLRSLGNLIACYLYLGEYEKALELNQKCYEICKENYGEKNQNTLIFLNNLATNNIYLKKYEIALDLNKKCYCLNKEINGEQHPNTIMSLNGVGVSYNCLGKIGEGIKVQEKCYSLSKEVLGEQHPWTLTFLNNLVVNYNDLGYYEKAKELGKICYESNIKIYGENHPNTIMSLDSLAVCYCNMGNIKEGLPLLKKCYEIRNKIFGELHPDTLQSLYKLALTHKENNDYFDSLEYLLLYIDRIKNSESTNILDIASCESTLGFLYIKLEKYNNAISVLSHCYETRKNLLGENDTRTKLALDRLIEAKKKSS